MSNQRKFTRREFVKATSALGVAAPFILPSSVWSAGVKPSNRITMGFVGVGTQGRGLLDGFLGNKETQVLAVSDVDTTRREHSKKTVEDRYAKQTGSDYKGCADYRDFRELIARKDIDAVCVATPDHWHAVVAISAANAKKDIYCEKPLSLTIREARRMVEAARKNDRVFQTGSMQRSSSEFLKACELVRNGRIGKVQQVIVDVGTSLVWCDLPEET